MNRKNSLRSFSPLDEYWDSNQLTSDNETRLNKINTHFPSELFNNEPYKWEILYQSIVKQLKNGDHNSIKGMKVLLMMLNVEEKTRVLQELSSRNILDREIIEALGGEITKEKTKRNIWRFVRILIAIFTNPYDLEIKSKKNRIYEKSGALIYRLKNIFN